MDCRELQKLKAWNSIHQQSAVKPFQFTINSTAARTQSVTTQNILKQ